MAGLIIVDIACGENHTIAATDRGEAFSWGEGRYGAVGVIDCYQDQFRP